MKKPRDLSGWMILSWVIIGGMYAWALWEVMQAIINPIMDILLTQGGSPYGVGWTWQNIFIYTLDSLGGIYLLVQYIYACLTSE